MARWVVLRRDDGNGLTPRLGTGLIPGLRWDADELRSGLLALGVFRLRGRDVELASTLAGIKAVEDIDVALLLDGVLPRSDMI